MRMSFGTLCALMLAACLPFAVPAPADSGIEGQALIGPTCPVVQEGQDCADKPYRATISIYDLIGRRVLRFQTDEAGRFRVPLAPGEYVLRPESPNTLPYAAEQSFTVRAHRFTTLVVQYDSGIR